MEERFRNRMSTLLADGWMIRKDWLIKGKRAISGYAIWNSTDESFNDLIDA